MVLRKPARYTSDKLHHPVCFGKAALKCIKMIYIKDGLDRRQDKAGGHVGHGSGRDGTGTGGGRGINLDVCGLHRGGPLLFVLPVSSFRMTEG